MSGAVCTVIVCSKWDIIVNVNHISCSAVHPFSRCLLLYFALFQSQASFVQKKPNNAGKRKKKKEDKSGKIEKPEQANGKWKNKKNKTIRRIVDVFVCVCESCIKGDYVYFYYAMTFDAQFLLIVFKCIFYFSIPLSFALYTVCMHRS